MQIKIVKVGFLATNCYIIENDKETRKFNTFKILKSCKPL